MQSTSATRAVLESLNSSMSLSSIIELSHSARLMPHSLVPRRLHGLAVPSPRRKELHPVNMSTRGIGALVRTLMNRVLPDVFSAQLASVSSIPATAESSESKTTDRNMFWRVSVGDVERLIF